MDQPKKSASVASLLGASADATGTTVTETKQSQARQTHFQLPARKKASKLNVAHKSSLHTPEKNLIGELAKKSTSPITVESPHNTTSKDGSPGLTTDPIDARGLEYEDKSSERANVGEGVIKQSSGATSFDPNYLDDLITSVLTKFNGTSVDQLYNCYFSSGHCSEDKDSQIYPLNTPKLSEDHLSKQLNGATSRTKSLQSWKKKTRAVGLEDALSHSTSPVPLSDEFNTLVDAVIDSLENRDINDLYRTYLCEADQVCHPSDNETERLSEDTFDVLVTKVLGDLEKRNFEEVFQTYILNGERIYLSPEGQEEREGENSTAGKNKRKYVKRQQCSEAEEGLFRVLQSDWGLDPKNNSSVSNSTGSDQNRFEEATLIPVLAEENKDSQDLWGSGVNHKAPHNIHNANSGGNDDGYQPHTTGTWVECVRCNKWRFLDQVLDPSMLDEAWHCGLQPKYLDGKKEVENPCEELQVELEDVREGNYVFTKFTAGSLVWAKLDGYPEWPAMVDCDSSGRYAEYDEATGEVFRYYIVFIDPKGTTRQKVRESRLRKFSLSTEFQPRIVSSRYRIRLEKAVKEAERAMKMSLEDRIFTYGYPYPEEEMSKSSKKTRKRELPKGELESCAISMTSAVAVTMKNQNRMESCEDNNTTASEISTDKQATAYLFQKNIKCDLPFDNVIEKDVSLCDKPVADIKDRMATKKTCDARRPLKFCPPRRIGQSNLNRSNSQSDTVTSDWQSPTKMKKTTNACAAAKTLSSKTVENTAPPGCGEYSAENGCSSRNSVISTAISGMMPTEKDEKEDGERLSDRSQEDRRPLDTEGLGGIVRKNSDLKKEQLRHQIMKNTAEESRGEPPVVSFVSASILLSKEE
ncbi:Zinc finger CW-type PWWP domain protein 1 [Clonorchis sinensis]|uniref:Zinc finger CW-type PWWP domain protein 1 n=1 Tax=Clonorchis sinensis TaxID=79923 RepID=A0A8T1MI72_CLOSI|nr:Zinc finger CW-type PWWP domain protein 1 [Clonorchis sinensis]